MASGGASVVLHAGRKMGPCFLHAAERTFGNLRPLPGPRRFLSRLDRTVGPRFSKSTPARSSPGRLPATFGLILWSGFEEMLLRGAQLPARKEITLHGIIDHIRTGLFQVVYRHSPLHTNVEIASVTLPYIRQALTRDTFIHVTMEIDGSLNGRFHVRDPFTKSEAWTEFNARVPPPEHGQDLLGSGGAERQGGGVIIGGPDT